MEGIFQPSEYKPTLSFLFYFKDLIVCELDHRNQQN